jgi:4-hydroxy-4-methyl-2-oxoglutarate aldolase
MSARQPAEVLAGYRRLYTALVSDALDERGIPNRVMKPGLLPIQRGEVRTVAGFAFPVSVRQTDEFVEIDRLLQMVDEVPAESMVVISADRDIDAALWGGLVSTGAQARGAAGAVVDGAVRDLHQLDELGFPVFATYRSPRDIRTRGEVVATAVPLECRGVLVSPGDVVVADAVGVVVVPREPSEEILDACAERLGREDATQRELQAGRGAAEVYKTYEAI